MLGKLKAEKSRKARRDMIERIYEIAEYLPTDTHWIEKKNLYATANQLKAQSGYAIGRNKTDREINELLNRLQAEFAKNNLWVAANYSTQLKTLIEMRKRKGGRTMVGLITNRREQLLRDLQDRQTVVEANLGAMIDAKKEALSNATRLPPKDPREISFAQKIEQFDADIREQRTQLQQICTAISLLNRRITLIERYKLTKLLAKVLPKPSEMNTLAGRVEYADARFAAISNDIMDGDRDFAESSDCEMPVFADGLTQINAARVVEENLKDHYINEKEKHCEAVTN